MRFIYRLILLMILWSMLYSGATENVLADSIDTIPIIVKGSTYDRDQLIGSIKYPEAHLIEKKIFDIQYQESNNYRVISLLEAIMSHQLPRYVDTANLIFQNGMIIPIPLNSSQSPPLWLAWQVQRRQKWVRDFENVSKKSDQWRDPRPITFQGQKIVVSTTEFFPHTNFSVSRGEFSPFKYSSSLIRIELINYSKWVQQFTVSHDKRVIQGQKVFSDRCQFCHGVRGIGATFGWDFVDPLPIFQKRKPDSLFIFVKLKKEDALERGLMMPHQSSLSETEALELWYWLRAAAQNELKPYVP